MDEFLRKNPTLVLVDPKLPYAETSRRPWRNSMLQLYHCSRIEFMYCILVI